MKKEVLIAIFAGFSLGLIITIGISNAQKSLQSKNAETFTQEETTSTPPQPQHQLTLIDPENQSVISDTPVNIIGTTTPLSIITVISPFDYSITTADETGNFSASLELEAGANLITVQSYSDNGELAQTDISIVHSTADLNQDQTPNNQTLENDSNEE